MVLRKPSLRRFLALSLAAILALGVSQPSWAVTEEEYSLKAAFLYHFGQFVEWPEKPSTKPFVIGILGKDPFGKNIDALETESLHGRRVEIRRLSRIEEASNCHIVYISSSEARRIPQILSQLRGQGVLTISDVSGFVKEGGMIHLLTEQNKIRFAINKKSADLAGLKISSQLLSLATNVVA
jgi:hypothetical protein